ncbi:MAG: PepSY-associated TM helix domain-containing protein [Flavobacteriaceae bacterium]|nr:PepSY-associated TM helix domain-containing protein [Flavobacteriaceae bacterium]
MHWRRLLKVLHRDIGYLAVGLTIIYAVSGVAVNHISDWNPNYRIEKTTLKLDSIPYQLSKDEMVNFILNTLNITDEVKNSFRPSPNELEIFLEGKTIHVNYQTKEATIEKVNPRFLIKETNDLHLNKVKGAWTYIADVFSVSLIFLAISGLFLLKGKNGITGRGAWLTVIGFAIPIIYLLIYYMINN